MLAEVLKSDGLYEQAITNYLLGQKLTSDINTTMIVANIYDEKLNNIPKSIYYYELYLNSMKSVKSNRGSEYIEKVKKRVEFLKTPKPANKQP